MPAATHYRPDIDGLRAVSVGAVILFHMGLPAFGGGFVGVDVFFVISGFLITGIVYEQTRAGRFSLVAFYDRRVRRIIPALVTVLAATLVFGYWVLAPDDYAALGASTAAAATSVANVYFYRNTGYFDGAAHLMPLLHTWSLAVEEQFYVVWPLLLAAVMRWAPRPRAALVVTALLALASFAVGLPQVAGNAKAAFYLPFARAWELALGVLLVFLPVMRVPRGVREIVAVAGMAGIAWAVFALSGDSLFPGMNALPPTVGAALIIWANRQETLTGRALALAPAVFIGKISYSLYLWHWPLFVYWRHYLGGAPLPVFDGVVLAVVAIGLSALSWRWVEQPCRALRGAPRLRIAQGVVASAVVAVAAVAVLGSGGVPGRLGPELKALGDRDVMWDWTCPQSHALDLPGEPCVVGAAWESAATRGLLWGDSHAEHYAPLFDVAGREQNAAFALYRSCPPFIRVGGIERNLPGEPRYNQACTEEREAALDLLRSSPGIEIVAVAVNWSYMPSMIYRGDPAAQSSQNGLELLRDGTDELLTELTALDRRVLLLGDVPHVGYEPIPCLLASAGFLLRRPCTEDPSSIPIDRYRARQQATDDLLREAAQRPHVQVLIPGDRLCVDSSCATYLNGEFLYRDEHHLRRNLKPATMVALTEQLGLASLIGRLRIDDR